MIPPFQKKTFSLSLPMFALGQGEEGEQLNSYIFQISAVKAKGKKKRLKTEVFSTSKTLQAVMFLMCRKMLSAVLFLGGERERTAIMLNK